MFMYGGDGDAFPGVWLWLDLAEYTTGALDLYHSLRSVDLWLKSYDLH